MTIRIHSARTSLAAALVSLAIMAPLTAFPAHAEDNPVASIPVARIAVSGEGTKSVAPDMAVLNLTVTREATTAREALDANNAAMNKVLSAMKDQGIEDRDLRTSGFSIQPQYVYPQPKQNGEQESPRITGYVVRNGLTVRVRDLAKLGAIMDESVTLGVNEGGNVTFTNDKPGEALKAARRDAVKDAMEKAKTLADAAGVTLGRIIEISEMANAPQPMPYAVREMAMAKAADAVPVAAGENSYSVTVNVTYAIGE